MSKLSGQKSLCVDSNEFLKPSVPVLSKKSDKFGPNTVNNLSGSCGDLRQVTLKSSPSVLSRDDSVSSKSSFKSLFPNIMQSFDNSSGFSISQSFVPRIEKTLTLFDIIINTLRDLNKKYSEYIHGTDSPESSERGVMCTKVENRIILIENLKSDYKSLIEEKKEEVKAIQSTIASALLNKNGKEDIDMLDCESYWTNCREMCIVESKLERCAGKLQFQIMELDSVSRVSPLDQYELSIRLNDISKFKTKIKVEKSGHQIWDNTTFVLNPTVDDTLDVKFAELKTLNKSLILLERKVPFVNNLILADPSIYTFWLTPVGTIKLKVIVQWNAALDDPDLMSNLNQIDNKFHDIVSKDSVALRKRGSSATGKFSHNRLSVNFGSLFRSDGYDLQKTSPRGSMENIAEQVDEDSTHRVNMRKGSLDRHKDKTKAEYIENVSQISIPPTRTVMSDVTVRIEIPSFISTDSRECDDLIIETIVPSDLREINIDQISDSIRPRESTFTSSNEENLVKNENENNTSIAKDEKTLPNKEKPMCDNGEINEIEKKEFIGTESKAMIKEENEILSEDLNTIKVSLRNIKASENDKERCQSSKEDVSDHQQSVDSTTLEIMKEGSNESGATQILSIGSADSMAIELTKVVSESSTEPQVMPVGPEGNTDPQVVPVGPEGSIEPQVLHVGPEGYTEPQVLPVGPEVSIEPQVVPLVSEGSIEPQVLHVGPEGNTDPQVLPVGPEGSIEPQVVPIWSEGSVVISQDTDTGIVTKNDSITMVSLGQDTVTTEMCLPLISSALDNPSNDLVPDRKDNNTGTANLSECNNSS